jgi:hypothetical protein
MLTLAVLINCLAPAAIPSMQSAFAKSGAVAAAPAAVTPEALASAATDFVTQIPITANDVVYSSSTQKLYVSVPSNGGANGNSITPVDPATGTLGTSVFIGSEPNKLGLSTDGQTLYAALDGASAIRRFDLTTQTPGQQFFLGLDNFNGPYRANDIAVAPGNPNLIAVARYFTTVSPSEAGVAIFDNGVQRAKTGPSHIEGSDFLAFSASASKLYGGGYSYGLRTMTVDSTGVTVDSKTSFNVGARIKFDNGLIYSSSGQVINPDTQTLLGTFSGASTQAFVPDSSVGRAFYLVRDISSNALTLKAFDINTYTPVGSLTISGINSDPVSMVRWGANGLAFTTSNNKLYIIQTSLISSAAPIPTPTPAVAPTPTPTPASIPTFVKPVSLQANDLVYNQSTQSLYASVPSTVGANGNSITAINPATGAIGTSVFIGSEPTKLALADDGKTIYTFLDGANAIRRFDASTQTAGAQFSLAAGIRKPSDIAVAPGNPNVVALAVGFDGAYIYDNGVQRTKGGRTNAYAINSIEFSSTESVLYGYDNESSGFELVKFTADSTGLTGVTMSRNLIGGYGVEIKYVNGLLYSSGGQVVNPETREGVGTFRNITAGLGFSPTSVAVDPSIGRVFFLSSGGGSGVIITAYDINTFLPLGYVSIPNISGTATSLVRWGTNGLAFRTGGSGGFGSTPGQVYIIETALVSASTSLSTGVGFSLAANSVFESTASASVTVTRSGDTSGTTTVDYATSGDTATAGTDYTTVSGTLTFAPGETSKTITIPIINDNVYEGNETFAITLSNVTGGGVLVSPTTTTVTIQDNETAPNIASIGRTVKEPDTGTSTELIEVRLSNPTTKTVTVNYATVDGTAKAGSDYVATSGTLTFNPLETSKTVAITINEDDPSESTETFSLALSNAVNVSFSNSGIISITNAPPGTLSFKTGAYSISEGGGSALITVNRTGGAAGTVTINYATTNGTATAGSDYTATSGTLTFAPGETTKTFSVPVTDDSAREDSETVNLSLSTVGGGAILGMPNTAVLTIVDNDSPSLQLSSSSYTINENAANTSQGYGSLTVDVSRSGDMSQAATVRYFTSDLSAGNECNQVTGQASQRCDYSLIGGTLRFSPGEATKSISIPVINDGYVEGPEFFTIRLENASGAAIGVQNQATITIVDDDTTASTGANNAYLNNEFFVRLNYMDFLGREPDAEGWNTWPPLLNNCGPQKGFLGAPPDCDRAHVSHGFFGSPEFTNTGFLIYRLYEVGMNRLPRYSEFTPDMASLSGFGIPESVQQQNLQDYLQQFTSKQEFTNRFSDALQPSQAARLVEKLEQTAGVTLPATATTRAGQAQQYGRAELIQKRASGEFTLGQIIKAFVEQQDVYDRYFPRGQVTMLYFAYLKRDPDLNDPSLSGWTEWVFVFTNGGAQRGRPDIAPRDIHHLIFGFIYSEEYRKRFGQP